MIICADHSMTWKRSYDDMDSAHIDASIVTDHMMLAAADRGLGSLWVCKFKPDIIRDSFGLPDNVEPVNLLCLGMLMKLLTILKVPVPIGMIQDAKLLQLL